jgi:hypothetical protein
MKQVTKAHLAKFVKQTNTIFLIKGRKAVVKLNIDGEYKGMHVYFCDDMKVHAYKVID